MEVTLQGLRAWVGEFFTPNQIVGTRAEGKSCLVANYLKFHGKGNVFVTPHFMSWSEDGDMEVTRAPLALERLIDKFDASGVAGTRVQARTALKLIRQVEADEQVTQPEREAEVSTEFVGTTPTVEAELEGQAVLS